MTMAAIGATTPPKMTSKSFSIYGAQIRRRAVPRARFLRVRRTIPRAAADAAEDPKLAGPPFSPPPRRISARTPASGLPRPAETSRLAEGIRCASTGEGGWGGGRGRGTLKASAACPA